MDFFHILALACIQGITEFLPISSSAHLILSPIIFGWNDQGLLMDIVLHSGTLLAVMIYFTRESLSLISGFFAVATQQKSQDTKLLQLIVLATIPVILAGATLKLLGLTAYLRDPLVIALANLIFAIPLWACDRYCKQSRHQNDLKSMDALILGIAQCLALIPGTSRSGVTMTAGRLLGLERESAAKFAMLMAIPTIMAALILALLDIAETPSNMSTMSLALGFGLSFGFAYLAISVLMRVVSKIGFLPFTIYRIILGTILFIIFW